MRPTGAARPVGTDEFGPSAVLLDQQELTRPWRWRRAFLRMGAEHGSRSTCAATPSSPEHQERLERFHDFFLARCTEVGTIPKVVDALIALHGIDRAAYAAVIGDGTLRAPETLRQYVFEATTGAERSAAKERWRSQRERRRAERRERVAET